MSIIHSWIQSFSLFSGLIPNAQKSHCFLSNVEDSEKLILLNILGFPLGNLPIRFLGVPLISSKLSHNNGMPLLQRITSRATSWTAKFLAYSGRLQHIKSVLFAIQSFWSAHFILPKSVSIYSKHSQQPSLENYGAKDSWKVISFPLKEGGLAVKNLEDWNKALILHHLVRVIQFSPTSLWASWVQSTVLKHCNFWHVYTIWLLMDMETGSKTKTSSFASPYISCW